MALRDDYAGPFDPDLQLAGLSRGMLARLGREYLLIGHLLDRVGQPLVAMEFGVEAYRRSAIEEWMAASPVYSKRMQRALGFEGSDVGTVFKNLQLEIGAPQQFMDFQFRLDSPEYGEFWLCHCGALLDVEPHGDRAVKLMCHDIEDPTFDATAAATHPRMVMRPIHRPPRIDGPGGNGRGRSPHCRWKVYIGQEVRPHEPHPNLETVSRSKLARLELRVPERDAEPGGWPDYSGPFDPGCQLEDFSHRALVILCQEVALQAQLLVRSFLLSQARNHGEEAARRLGRRQWIGHAALAVERLRHGLGLPGDDLEAVAKFLQLHPAFHPRDYVDLRVERSGERRVRVEIRDCPALEEGDPYSWFAQLGPDPHPALEALVAQVNPRARCRPVSPRGAARLAWEVEIDPAAEPRPEPEELKLARLSGGLGFRFEQRRPLRVG